MEAGSGGRRGVSVRAALLALLVATALAGQGVRPLTDTTEARYAEVAREMLVSGDWLTPTLGGIPHLTKPPFATWLMAGSMAVFGVNEAGARAPGVLALLVAAILVARVARLLGRPEASGWAAVLFGASAGALAASVFPSTDMILTALELGAVTAYLAHERGTRGARLAFFALLGGAFLTKGPPGLLIPLAVVLGDRVRRRTTPPRPLFTSWAGWALFLTLGFGWYAAIVLGRPETARYWIGDEVVGRLFSGRHGREQTPLVYLLALSAGILPWWFLVPGFLRRRLPEVTRGWRTGTRPILLAWVVLPLIVFTVSRSRLPAYVLPLLPALVLALAFDRPRGRGTAGERWYGLRPEVFLAYGILVAALSWASVPLAAAKSWKPEARALARRVRSSEVEVISFRREIASSLTFYLAPARERIVVADERGAGPQTLAALAEAWSTDPEPPKTHVFVTRGSEDAKLAELPGIPPSLVGEKHGVRVWIAPPVPPDSTRGQRE